MNASVITPVNFTFNKTPKVAPKRNQFKIINASANRVIEVPKKRKIMPNLGIKIRTKYIGSTSPEKPGTATVKSRNSKN